MPAVRRIFQQRQLLADGHKALAAINAGQKAADIALTFPGSRARMYRAINAAMQDDAEADRYAEAAELEARAQFEHEDADPLLL